MIQDNNTGGVVGSLEFCNCTYGIDLVIEPTIADDRHLINVTSDLIFRFSFHQQENTRHSAHLKSKFHNAMF